MIIITTVALISLYIHLRKRCASSSSSSSSTTNENDDNTITENGVTICETETVTFRQQLSMSSSGIESSSSPSLLSSPGHSDTTTTTIPNPKRILQDMLIEPAEDVISCNALIVSLFTSNAINGIGFLAIPWAFERGGLVLSTFLLVLIVMLKNLSKTYFLESFKYAEALVEEEGIDDVDRMMREDTTIVVSDENSDDKNDGERGGMEEEEEELMCRSVRTTASAYGSTERSFGEDSSTTLPMANLRSSSHRTRRRRGRRRNRPPLDADTDRISTLQLSLLPSPSMPPEEEQQRDVEALEVCRIILGKHFQTLYVTFNILFTYGVSWCCIIVFGNAMTKLLPLSRDAEFDYVLYVAIFAFITIPVSCCCWNNAQKQKRCEAFFTIGRIILILMMGTTSIVAGRYTKRSYELFFDEAIRFRFKGTYETLPILLFSTSFHRASRAFYESQTSSLLGKEVDSIRYRNVFMVSNTFWGFALTFFGVSVAWYFNDTVRKSANLSWEYSIPQSMPVAVEEGGKENNVRWGDVSLWSRVVYVFVVGFPALDALMAFPRNVISLKKDLMGLCAGCCTDENNTLLHPIYHLLSILPPIIGSLFIKELGNIADYTGVLALILQYIFPSAFYIKGRHMAKQCGISVKTHYQGFFSWECWAWAILILCVQLLFSIVLCLVVPS